MRIALITPGFSADDDDWCIPVLQNLARSLSVLHDIEVMTISYPYRSGEYTVKGVAARSFGTSSQSAIQYSRRMLWVYRHLTSANSEKGFDLLHGFWSDQGGLMAACAGRRLQLPVVVTAMGGELTYNAAVGYGRRHQWIRGRLARFGASRATILTGGSEFYRDRLGAEQPDLSCDVVPLGVDTSTFSQSGPGMQLAGESKLLMVGSLERVKGHDVALQALAEARQRLNGLHLHIIGDGPLREPLSRQAETLGVNSHVTFHGHVQHDELPRYYRGADLCLLTSYFETAAMVILEAGACGRTTIGSEVGLLPQITPAEYCVAPGNPTALAESIVRLCSSPRELGDLGIRVAELVRNEYSLEAMVSRFESIYDRARHS